MMAIKIIVVLLVVLYVGSFFIESKNTLHGSAVFKRSKHLGWWNKGFRFGRRKRLSGKMSFRHCLLCAPTGSGKTQTILAWNALVLPKYFSTICLDPKMELFALSAGYNQQVLGCEVYCLNVADPSQSAGWNPLEGLALDEAQTLATELYDIVNPKDQEAIWKYGSISLLTNSIRLLLLYDKGRFASLANLEHVLHTLQSNGEAVLAWADQHLTDEFTLQALTGFLQSEDKIRQGILSGAIASIVPYCSPATKKISRTTTLPSIADMRKKRTIIYLGLPIGTDTSASPFITLFLSRFFGELMRAPFDPREYSISCLLEEFGNLNAIGNYPALVATVRSKGVMLLHCLQNLDQLEQVYGDSGAEIIANNCSSWLVLPGLKSGKTLRYIRENLLGSMTEYDELTQRHVSRSLLNNDEIRRLKKGYGLFVCDNEQPDLLRLRPLYASWIAKYRFGLRSSRGRLVSKYEPTRREIHEDSEIPLLNFSSTNTDTEQTEFERLLKKHFPE